MRCLASDVKTIDLGEDLFGEGAKVFGDVRRTNRVMQCAAHDGEDVSKIVGQTLFDPIGFPVIVGHKEEIDGPAVGIGATGAGEVFKESLQRLLQGGQIFGVGKDERVGIVEEWLKFGRNGFSASRFGRSGAGFFKTWHSVVGDLPAVGLHVT